MLAEVRNIPPSSYLTHDFQDWLTKVGLMKRSQVENPNLDCFTQPLTFSESELWNKMREEYGYVIPRDHLLKFLGGRQTGITLKNKMGDIRRKLVEPESLYVVPNLGYGVGMQDFTLAPVVTYVTKCLYDRLGEWVPEDEFIRSITRDHNVRVPNYAQLREFRKKTQNRYFKGTGASLEFSGFYLAYRLTERTNFMRSTGLYTLEEMNKPSELSEGIRRVEDCLADEDFQQWMKKMSIIHKLDIPMEDAFRVLPGKFLSGAQRDFCELVSEFYGSVVNKRNVARILYGSDKVEAVGALTDSIDQLKGKLSYPQVLLQQREKLLGIGIEKFILTPRAIVLCYTLWRNKGMWVEIDDIADSLYGIERDQGEVAVASLVHDLNNQLRRNNVNMIVQRDEDRFRLVKTKK